MRLPFGVSLGLFSCRMPLYTKVGQGLLSNQKAKKEIESGPYSFAVDSEAEGDG